MSVVRSSCTPPIPNRRRGTQSPAWDRSWLTFGVREHAMCAVLNGMALRPMRRGSHLFEEQDTTIRVLDNA